MSDRDSGRKLRYALGVCLFAWTCIAYAPVVHHDFVNFDDLEHVVHNPNLNRPATLANLLSHFVVPFGGNLLPVYWISLQLGFALHGPDPAAFLLGNVLLHATSSAVLFAALCSLTGAVWRSAFVAAVFALHPLRVESVAWAVERKDVLAGLFFMLAYELLHSGRPEEARDHYRAAIAIAPSYTPAYYGLAKSLSDAGDRDAAIAAYQSALNRQPNLVLAHASLGLLLLEAGRLAEARRHLLVATRARPDSFEYREAFAEVTRRLARPGPPEGPGAHRGIPPASVTPCSGSSRPSPTSPWAWEERAAFQADVRVWAGVASNPEPGRFLTTRRG